MRQVRCPVDNRRASFDIDGKGRAIQWRCERCKRVLFLGAGTERVEIISSGINLGDSEPEHPDVGPRSMTTAPVMAGL